MKKIALFFILLTVVSLTYGNIQLPKILADNMVLQRNKPITIWGWAEANEKITAQFKKQVKTTKANTDGSWKVVFEPEPAGGPFQLILKGKNSITINNVLIGEVWVCSGQSNMEWPLHLSNHSEEEIQGAHYPEIHHFTVSKSISVKPEEDVKGGDWKICNPATAGDFTAVGYFFARELYRQLKIPIGIINTSWGGTHSETWTSREAFEGSPEFKDMISNMPSLDLEGLAKLKKEKMFQELKNFNVALPSPDEAGKWKQTTYDDNQWPVMKLPTYWESQGLSLLDGFVWFRKSVNISAADAGKEATLQLGKINDSDETYINGQKVGSSKNKASDKRNYKIEAGILKEGLNVIAVRVEDVGNVGGIYGDASDLKLTTNPNTVIPLSGEWKFNVESILTTSPPVSPNTYPTLLFNAMIHPILNYPIAGALWYQGESNAGRAFQYRTAFPLMIQDWRKHWKLGDFPFYFVQLASFNAANGTSEKGSSWAELREAQTMALSLPNTGMAVTIDIGNANDIHPRNKQDVGKRLAAIALSKMYGLKNPFNGPVYRSMKVEGNKVRLTFDNVGSGLMIKDKYGYLKGFELAGEDKKFHYAKAWIEGKEVIVAADSVQSPVAVRYAWADNPEEANLFNQEGLPAWPFRTDHWRGITEEVKFQIN